MAKGRLAENNTVIKVYTQEFKDHNGETFTWEWDKNINPNGPLSVTIKDPQWATYDKKEKQLVGLLEKYEVKKGERKPRVTKADKDAIEQLEHEMDEIFYSFYPEDRDYKKGKNNRKTLI
jgi:cell division protein FtsI/penicillin-binding protein 2